MEARPNLERTSSLTCSGIGGLNWDRTAVIPTTTTTRTTTTETIMNTNVPLVAKPARGASFSVVEQSPSPPPPPVSVVDSLLAEVDGDDDDPLLPPPSLLRRSVTFSGDFPHGENESETLVATAPPGILGGPRMVQRRQRATSDAEAVKAAWGTPEPGSLSPEASAFPFSPAHASQHKSLPRRAHSMSLDTSVWGTGVDSPRERSRTMNTLSVGSPDTEVLEYMDGDDVGFSSVAPRGSKLGQSTSPLQHTLFPSVSTQLQQGTLSQQQTPPIQGRFAANQPSVSAPQFIPQQTQQSVQQQSFVPPRHTTPPSFPSYSQQAPSLGGMQGLTPPQMAMGMMPPVMAGMGGETAFDQNLVEVQLQNLHAMQQQWMQMMQMQLDQTLYATQQRLQNMQLGSASTTPPNLAFQGKGAKYPGVPMNPYDANLAYPQQPQQQHTQQAQQHQQMGYGSPGGVTRGSPPNHRAHRRQGGERNAAGNTSEANGGGGGQGGHGASSSLLTEHKITGRRLTAQELAGHVVEFSRDSHCSRLVQFKMETGTPEERRGFVTEALPHTLSLARDLFGNYVIQNFFDNAALDQRDMLAIALMGNVSALCTHPHGCRVVQRALFAVSPPRRNDLIEELLELQSANNPQTESIIRSCARDAHATHVLQKAVTCLQKAIGLKGAFKEANIPEDAQDPPQERARALKALEKIEANVLADCIPMCTHQQACRLVQRVLGACEPGRISPRVDQILKEVFRNIDALAIHQNGNFVLQHILEATEPSLAAKVQAYVCTNAVRLARHKFGSHLVEKSLSCATPAQVTAIVERFLAPLTKEMMDDVKDDFESSISEDTSSGLVPSALPVLMKDPYANFVVQKAFDVSKGEIRGRLSQEIRARTASLSKFSYGRHILTHINRAGSNNAAPSSEHTHQ